MGTTNSKTGAFIWNGLEKFGTQAIQFVIGIILARILSPRDYGLVGILLVFTAIAQILIDSGFTKALIQKNNPSREDLSTVFTFNLVVSTGLYLLLFLSAPWIANFYEEPQLINLLRVLGLILISNALFAIPNTILSIQLDFRTIAAINTISIFISGIVAIVLAYNGFGVWSLILQYLLKSILTLVLFWFKKSSGYGLYFSKKSFKELFRFGSNLMLSSLLNVVVAKFSSIFIAKYISTKDLGYFTRGLQFPEVAIGTLGAILDTVLLPTLAADKDSSSLRPNIKKVFTILNLVTLPLSLILAIVAEPLILLLLTEKWIAIVPILQIFCISRYFNNFISVNVNIMYVLDKTDLVLKQHYYKIAIRIIFILCALPFGLIYIALAEALTSLAHFIINAYYPGRFIDYGISKQVRQLLPHLGIATILFFGISSIMPLIPSLFLQLCFGTLCGLFGYILLVKIGCKNDYQTGLEFGQRLLRK